MSKKRIVSILLVFILILVSNNANMMKTSAAMKPKIKRVSLVSSTTVSVVWNKVPNAKSYEVYCSRESGVFKKVKTVKSTNYTFKNLDLGTEYSYKVKAIVKGKKSGFSNTKKIKTNNWAYLLDVAKPYNKPYWYRDELFSVAGNRFSHGFTCMGYGSGEKHELGNCTYFNLKGKFSKIELVAGVVDASGSESSCDIRFFTDDAESDSTLTILPNDLVKKTIVNLNYCNKFMISVSDNYYVADGSGVYGLGNIKVYK